MHEWCEARPRMALAAQMMNVQLNERNRAFNKSEQAEVIVQLTDWSQMRILWGIDWGAEWGATLGSCQSFIVRYVDQHVICTLVIKTRCGD